VFRVKDKILVGKRTLKINPRKTEPKAGGSGIGFSCHKKEKKGLYFFVTAMRVAGREMLSRKVQKVKNLLDRKSRLKKSIYSDKLPHG